MSQNRYLLMLFSCILANGYSTIAQTLKSDMLNDVIKIESGNVAQIGNSYLVDIPVSGNNLSATFYNDARIPDQLLCRSRVFYPFLKEFIIISPDWAYYKAVAEHATKAGITCAEPVTTNKVFHVTRGDNGIRTDSTTIRGEQPVLNFSDHKTKQANAVLVYYSESYGSACCPYDPRRDNPYEGFASGFEIKHHVKIKGTYMRVEGEEGEHTTFFTLEGLTPLQKLQFITERDFSLRGIKSPKDISRIAPQVYTPWYVPAAGLTRTDSK